MTKWERFYRWLGGRGPGEFRVLYPGEWAFAGKIAKTLAALGLLKRDAELPVDLAGWYVNYRWQWRFWRGRYADCFAKMRAEGRIQ